MTDVVATNEEKLACESCIYYPPSSTDGKPCGYCNIESEYFNCYQEVLTMSDLIYREDAKDFVRHAWSKGLDVIEYLDEVPAADVRSVVLCGKCKYGKYTGTEWFCDKHSVHADKFGEDASYHEYHSKNFFCADGEERKHD